ncbi:MAG: aldehyde dehydrogenase family protein [Acholeplasmatales bacterium]|nr:MAG: aldehyde dehydrogenase family protein [Acholeplasmatales bacterium]
MEQHETTIEQLVTAARAAQEKVADYTQSQIDAVCVAIGWAMYHDKNIRMLAEQAVAETGMGNVGDKITKHKNKVLGVLKDIKHARSVGIIERDEAKKITRYAKPVGVVGALTPVTNPTATPASNAITILKGRNAVIFAPHPKAEQSTTLAVGFMRAALRKVGAPEDLIQVVTAPSIPKTQALLKAVDVILATGGSAMVKAAYSSGTPAYGVGPGNAVQLIAEDAEIEDAAEKIMMSKRFDYATSCSSENALVIHESVYDAMMQAMVSRGAYRVQGDERAQLKAHMWVTHPKGHRVLNSAIIAQSAQKIAADAGLDVPADTDVLLVEGDADTIETDPFSEEKIAPVLTLYRCASFSEGASLLERLTNHSGTGHSCGIHTFNTSYIDDLGKRMKTSRIMVNQPQAAGNGGAFFNGMPSTVSLGCGSWGGNITSENIHYKHFLNITWVSEWFPPQKPSEREIFGHWLDETEDASNETA